jgi:putative DNA primase/helicase
MSNAPDIMKLAQGKWPSVLMSCGLEGRFLTGKHSPCPLCGGKDRFRYIDKTGDGWWICNQCGSGDGMDLLMGFTNQNFVQARDQIRPIVGGCTYSKLPTVIDKKERQRRMKNTVELWDSGIKNDPLLHEYMADRGLKPEEYDGADLRVAHNVSYYDEDGNHKGKLSVMLARVSTRDGKLALIHRTYLAKMKGGGFKKKKKMTQRVREWKGGCIRLFGTKDQNRLIVAEGIETALSVRARFYRTHGILIPCWAAVNAKAMENMALPEHLTNIMIAGDSDASFTGQKAAMCLANRLTVHDKRQVKVMLPEKLETDFNDELKEQYGQVSDS